MAEAPVCPICTEDLKDPRVLPCGHCYCGPPEECLKILKQPDGIVKCAICNAVHVLDVDKLEPLYGIRDFLKETNKGSTINHGTNFPCCEVHKSKQISYWCIQCSYKICETCLEDDHEGHSVKTYKRHLQKEVNARLTCLGVEEDAFQNEMQIGKINCETCIGVLKLQIRSYQKELNEMEKKKNIYVDLMKNESTLRAFASGSSDADFKLTDALLTLMDESTLPIALGESRPLIHGFTFKASFYKLDSWEVEDQHYSSGVLINGCIFKLNAKRCQKTGTETHYLSLFVYCRPLHYRTGWNYEIKSYIIRLKNSLNEQHLVKKIMAGRKFDESANCFGFRSFIEWNELLKSNFMWKANGKSSIRVEATVDITQ